MYKLPDNNCVISFSGGRTSGFMLKQIIDYNDGLPDNAVVCFANTGREMPQTLEFINDCPVKWDDIVVRICSNEKKTYLKLLITKVAVKKVSLLINLLIKQMLPNFS